jgi:hypothetical protein
MTEEINFKASGSKPANHQQRRQEARRIKLGTKFMEENDKRINDRTYQYLAEAYLEKQRIRESGDQTAVPVPVTTRGIGLNITSTFNYLEARHNKAVRYSQLDRHSLYRVSLAQMEKQLFEGQNIRPGRDFDPLIIRDYARVEYQDWFPQLNIKDNIGLVSHAINSLGTFEYNQTIFRTYVPEMKLASEVPSSSTTSRKRMATDGECITPDPYLIRISNLRQVVLSLSDPNTDPNVRERFRKLDPIPGSEWDDNDVLLNPNDIMPADYNRPRLQHDQMTVANFFAGVKRFDNCYVLPVNLDGSGRQTVLTTTHQAPGKLVLWNEFNTRAYEHHDQIDDLAVRCLYPLSSTDTLSAVLSLMSEWPVDWPQHTIPGGWSMRVAALSSYGYSENWQTFVGNVLNTIPKPVAHPGH